MIYAKPKEILAEIKRIMDIEDIPMKELAARLDTSQQNLSKIFKTANPRCSTLFEICKVLNLEMDIKFISKTKDDTK